MTDQCILRPLQLEPAKSSTILKVYLKPAKQAKLLKLLSARTDLESLSKLIQRANRGINPHTYSCLFISMVTGLSILSAPSGLRDEGHDEVENNSITGGPLTIITVMCHLCPVKPRGLGLWSRWSTMHRVDKMNTSSRRSHCQPFVSVCNT